MAAAFPGVDEFISPSEFLRGRYIEWSLPPEKTRVQANALRSHPAAMLPRHVAGPPLPAAFFGQHSPSRAWTSSSAPPARSARRLPNHLRLVGELAAIEGRVDQALADLPANVSEEGGLEGVMYFPRGYA